MHKEKLRAICLAFPGVTEDIKWGHDLCFLIGGKMFCVTGVDGDFSASLKVADEEFELLCERPNLIPAPYLARHKWVLATAETAFSQEEWAHYLRQSYDLVFEKLPAKTKKEILGKS
ncbi:MAG: MmcQ/YjbR family DNA-binding protein [Bacteroidia bacterium]|nr:MmcQ/YjbR family DNA-binding protein [Bacteroidia bacterium]